MKAGWNLQVNVWYVLRVFYAFSLIFAVPLFLIALFNRSHDPEVSGAIVIGSLIYFALGYVLFSVLPRVFVGRLERLVSAFAPAFKPDFVVRSALLNSYVGVDRSAGQLVYVDLASGKQASFDVPEVVEWEVEPNGKSPALLKLTTQAIGLPLVALRFHWRETVAVAAQLKATFG